MTLDKQIAAQEAFLAAPRRLARLRERRHRRDRRVERQAWIDKAAQLDPAYPEKLEAARQRVDAASFAVDKHERRRRLGAKRGKLDGSPNPRPVAAPEEARGATGETLTLGGGVSRKREFTRGLVASALAPRTLAQVAAEAELEAARAHLKALERWPARLEVAMGGDLNAPPPAGETSEQRIANARHVSFGMNRIPLRVRNRKPGGA